MTSGGAYEENFNEACFTVGDTQSFSCAGNGCYLYRYRNAGGRCRHYQLGWKAKNGDSKDFFYLRANEDPQIRKTLADSRKVFEETQHALIEGGKAPSDFTMGEYIQLPKAYTPEIEENLSKALSIYEGFDKTVNKILKGQATPADYEQIKQENMMILALIDEATTLVQEVSESKVQFLKVTVMSITIVA